MKYKVGDKAKVRNDLVFEQHYGTKAYVSGMSKFSGKEVTIERVYELPYDRCYTIKEDGCVHAWTDEMFEDDSEEIAKFRAFLEEVANLDSDGYNKEFAMLARILEYGQDGCDGYNYKESVDELCNFYKTFTPKKETKKKMTKAEIEDALGYKIEIIEESEER